MNSYQSLIELISDPAMLTASSASFSYQSLIELISDKVPSTLQHGRHKVSISYRVNF